MTSCAKRVVVSALDDAVIVNEPERRWSPTTLLTATMIVLFVLSIVDLVWNFSVVSMIGFAPGALFAYWVVAGCARRGEPLARRVMRHMRD